MRMLPLCAALFLFPVGLLSQSKFDDLKSLQEASDHSFQSMKSFSARFKLCSDMKGKLDTLKAKERNEGYKAVMEIWLAQWNSRVTDLKEQKKKLVDTLYILMEQRARGDAEKYHPLSTIEKFVPEAPLEKQEGDLVRVSRPYVVRMVSRFLKHIFKFKVIVEGTALLNDQTSGVDKSTIED